MVYDYIKQENQVTIFLVIDDSVRCFFFLQWP